MKTPEILGMLAASFPRFELTKDTVKVYSMLLADVPEDLLKAAALQCARKCTFFPSVHEIMEQVIGLSLDIEGFPSLFDAYREATTAPKGHEWSHPIVKQIAYQLGWNEYQFPGDNPAADRAHFADAYKRARQEIVDNMITPPEVKLLLESKVKAIEDGKADPRITAAISSVAQSMRVK